MTTEERARRRAELLAELVELAQEELPEPPRTLDELEDLTARVSEEATRAVLEKLAQRQQETELPTEHTCAQCHRRAQYKGRYGLEIVTSLGRIRLSRPYFYCQACRQGAVPLDATWRLGPGNTTPQAQARVAYLAHATPYHRLPASFQQLGLPLRLDVSTCEKITQAIGTALAQSPPPGPGPETGSGVLVVQVDGVMFPTRDGYREAQCGVLYEPDPAANRSPEGGAGLRKEFWGAIQDRAGVIDEACHLIAVQAHQPVTRGPFDAVVDRGAVGVSDGPHPLVEADVGVLGDDLRRLIRAEGVHHHDLIHPGERIESAPDDRRDVVGGHDDRKRAPAVRGQGRSASFHLREEK